MRKDNNEPIRITNRYAFAEVMKKDLQLSARVISVTIGRKVSKIRLAESEKELKSSDDLRGVRFDVWFEDNENRMYDLELQVYDEKNLTKRMAFYQGKMIVEETKSGAGFEDIKEVFVIFICTGKDPFERRRTVYQFETKEVNDDSIIVEDERHAYVLNFTEEREKSDNEELEEIAEYFIHHTVKENGISEELDELVKSFNEDREWRNNIMTFGEELVMAEKRGHKQGREEGIGHIAMNMLKMGLDIDMIAEVTGLSVEEIQRLILTSSTKISRIV